MVTPGSSRPVRFLSFACADMIAAAHLVIIVGMLLYDPDNQVIPPIHTMTTALPLQLMVLSYFGYQVGRLLARRPPPQPAFGPDASVPPAPGGALVLLACGCAVVVLAVQLLNMRSKGSLADVAFAKANAAEEFGPLNRIVFTVLPYLAGLLYYASFFHKRLRWLALPVAAACLAGLALTLFKVSVVFLLVQLVYLSLIARGQRTLSLGALLRFPKIAAALAGLAVGMYYLSEGEDLKMSAMVVLSRALVFSWEGFAYTVETPAPPDFADQWRVFSGAGTAPSPDVLLATQMLGVDPPPIGIVVTLPGFLFRNFELLGVGLGALVLGWCAQYSLQRATRDARPASIVLWLSLYLALVEIFLVGNALNTLRGGVLSLWAIYAVAGAAERMGRPTRRRPQEAPARWNALRALVAVLFTRSNAWQPPRSVGAPPCSRGGHGR